MAPNSKARLAKLVKDYKIEFDGPIDSLSESKWPETCSHIFRDIRNQGKIDFIQYKHGSNVGADGLRYPWKYEVPRRAERITEMARRCLKGRKNEGGWRLSLESEIMGRFTVEVACRKCRGRLWRSEREVAPHDSLNEGDYNSLSERQKRRKPCKCDPWSSSDDIYEQGISALFDDRADEAIIFEPELQKQLPTREQRPDRVYGLHLTARLERLLNFTEDKRTPAARTNTIGETLRCTPFRQDGEPIVFPFLILEAKSEKGSDSLTDIQTQTAFAIRELLNIQQELNEAADEHLKSAGGPLVWFLSYNGPHWRVSAAYIDHRKEERFFRIVDLWMGRVDSRDNALQLLLILDYIVDWARDIYRAAIAESLTKLAAHDSRSLAYDPDIASLVDNQNTADWLNSLGSETLCSNEPEIHVEDQFRIFDTREGVIRDGTLITSRFIGILITEDNLKSFINSESSDKASKTLIEVLLNSLEEAYRVKRSLLEELEHEWTNAEDNVIGISSPDEVFVVSVAVVAYITLDWEQTRELSYVAVAESLIPSLFKILGQDIAGDYVSSNHPLLESLPSFRSFLNRDARENLFACASRLCIYGSTHGQDGMVKKIQENFGIRNIMKMRLAPRCKSRDLAYSLYLKHKVGRNEPTSPIFRLSLSLDEVGFTKSVLQCPELLKWDPHRWEKYYPQANKSSAEIVFSTFWDQERANICLFVLDPPALKKALLVRYLAYDPSLFLFVRRHDRTWGKGRHMTPRRSPEKIPGFSHARRYFLNSLQNIQHSKISRGKTHWDVIASNPLFLRPEDRLPPGAQLPYKRNVDLDSLEPTLLRLQAPGKKVGPPSREYITISDDEPMDDKPVDDEPEVAPSASANPSRSPDSGGPSRPSSESIASTSTSIGIAGLITTQKIESMSTLGVKRPRSSVGEAGESESSGSVSRKLRPRRRNQL